MSLNLHTFVPNENVDYRQVNDNFSAIDTSVIKYVQGTVVSYNNVTYSATVTISGTNYNLTNKSINSLAADDTVLVGYITDFTTDGFIAYKLGTQTPEAGSSISIGKYLNAANNSALINNTDETDIDIQSSNDGNNLIVGADSFIKYATPITGETFYRNNIIGSFNLLYNVLMQSSSLIGSSNILNTYESLVDNQYTFKDVFCLIGSNIFGYLNNFSNNKTTYSTSFSLLNNSTFVGNGNSYTLNDTMLHSEGIVNSILSGNSNSIQNSKLDSISVFGNSNVFDNISISDTSVFGNGNSLLYLSTQGGSVPSKITMVGGGNGAEFKFTTVSTHPYYLTMLGYSNSYHNYINNNTVSSTILDVNINGYGNQVISLVSYLYVYGSQNSIADGTNCSRLFTIGHNNNISPTNSTYNYIYGYSNTIAGKLNYSIISGIQNNIQQSYNDADTATNTKYINGLMIYGTSNVVSKFNSNRNNIDILCFEMFGYGNKYYQTKNEDTSDYVSMLGNNNEHNNYAEYLTILGSGNNSKALQSSNVIGHSNIVTDNSTDILRIIANKLNIFGESNTITDTNTNTNHNIENSNIFGSNNILNITNNYSPISGAEGMNHTIIGNCGVIDYSVNNDAYQMKFVVGVENLYDSSTPNPTGNALVVDYQGNLTVTGTISSQGADFAEYWEWEDGNPMNEDRRGLFVTLSNNGKIKLASTGNKLLGIVSSKPTIAGGDDMFEWHGKYLKDVFGDYVYEDIEDYDEVTGKTTIIHRRKLNPDYDPTQTYTSRRNRPEYCCVAHLGKVVMIDDGSTNTGDYLTTSENGVATKSEQKTKYVCIKRIDEIHIQVLIGFYE